MQRRMKIPCCDVQQFGSSRRSYCHRHRARRRIGIEEARPSRMATSSLAKTAVPRHSPPQMAESTRAFIDLYKSVNIDDNKRTYKRLKS
jgi:hypothetical protein